MQTSALGPRVAGQRLQMQGRQRSGAAARRLRRPAQAVARAADGLPSSSGTLTPYAADPDTIDVISVARQRMNERQAGAAGAPAGPVNDFLRKLRLAWQVFFPERPRALTPKEEGKKRLRMILVADRCGMSADSLSVMKERIVHAMSEYVDISEEEAVEVSLSVDPDLGTIYSVAVPVRRVKPQARLPLGNEEDGAILVWDPTDPDSDPSTQFPYGA
eukprot:scaffold8.g1623.t1